jgi:ABC-type multidrug transport system fused ATPase/permease subunit
LFHEAIRGEHMKNSAVLLVTHQTNFLPLVDKVLVLGDGKVDFFGSYAELRELELFHQLGLVADVTSADDEESGGSAGQEGIVKVTDVKVEGGKEKAGVLQSVSKSTASGKLVSKEDKKIGNVSLDTLKAWIKDIGGVWILIAVTFILLVANVGTLASSYWVSMWTNNALSQTQEFYISGYAIFIGGVALISFLSSVFYAYCNLRGSSRLHDRVFAKVLRGTSSWFDVTPIGRILNRFSGDLDSVDTKLLDSSQNCFNMMIQSLLSLVAIAIIFPYFLIAVIPIAAVLLYFTGVFQRAVRQVKRLDSISRSPLFEHVSASITGLASVRAYSCFDSFKRKHISNVDLSARTYFCFFQLSRWFGLQLDTMVCYLFL